MHEEGDMASGRYSALIIWGVCVALLLGPALMVWLVRGVAFAAACAPGPGPCRGMALGGGLRDTLMLAWLVSTNTLFLVTVSVIATLAAFSDRRPFVGTLTLLLLPIVALALPALAVYVSLYEGCQVNSDGIGNCAMWGARMGMSFHTAATVPDTLVGLIPYSAALAVMMGLIGLFMKHRPHTHHHPKGMTMRNFGETRHYDE
jgi:hypothetical protein